ncbi:hypothetical protein [Chryseobacterium sp. ON_d1]|uniref:hypothetical protein n=1 Tax=Chryseobacterium sp. ON_d1 TaxID=2583211 RepID=UPI001E645833|nr:hypothetical protein [Chryseobacterium sp. ON_d1]
MAKIFRGATENKKEYNSFTIIIHKMDRFSRKTGDAYQMINLLRSFNVEPEAIE